MLAGIAIAVLIAADPSRMAAGVSPWVGIAAASVFFLAGAIMVGHESGLLGSHQVLASVVLAIFMTVFAAVSMIFPPGGIFVVFLAVNAWIQVYRAVHQALTGRDPFAGMSQEKQLGIGCIVFLLLALLVVVLVWWRSGR